MAVDHARVKHILTEAEALWDAKKLTKEDFLTAWADLEKALGDGPERDGMEGLILFADPEWLPLVGIPLVGIDPNVGLNKLGFDAHFNSDGTVLTVGLARSMGGDKPTLSKGEVQQLSAYFASLAAQML